MKEWWEDDVRLRAYRRTALEHAIGWLTAGTLIAFVVVMLVIVL